MNQSKPVIVYVGNEADSTQFTNDSGWVVFAAPALRDALAQTIFSYPDAIVIDATHDMVLAEDTYYHLRTINHPPIIILSDMPLRWHMPKNAPVTVISPNTDSYALMSTISDYINVPAIIAS